MVPEVGSSSLLSHPRYFFMKKINTKPKTLFQLSLWLAGGLILLFGTYSMFASAQDFNNSEAAGWLNLFGFGAYVLLGLLILFSFDLLYVILFLRWLLLSRNQKDKDDNVLFLP